MPPELPELEGVRHTYHQVNGFRVHVAEAGDPEAPPLVMQHGWPQHWWSWHKVIPQLAEHYHVICPDLRGHGWSDAPAAGYDKPQFAADLIGVLDALELDKVRLVGHDWGAVAGYLACIRHPERFERYLALSIAPPFPTGEKKDLLQVWRLWYQLPITAPLIGPRVVSRPDVIAMFLRKGTVKKGAMSDRDIALYAEAIAARPHVSLGIYRAFITGEVFAMGSGKWAGPLRVPTCIMLGEFEPVADADRARKGAERYADDFEVVEVPGVGHFLPEEAPEALVERATKFFA